MDGYGAGWSGPGAKTSGMNIAEEEQYKEFKHKLQAEEQQKKDDENVRRVSMGQKPCQLSFPPPPSIPKLCVIHHDSLSLVELPPFWMKADVVCVLVKDGAWFKVKKQLKRMMM